MQAARRERHRAVLALSEGGFALEPVHQLVDSVNGGADRACRSLLCPGKRHGHPALDVVEPRAGDFLSPGRNQEGKAFPCRPAQVWPDPICGAAPRNAAPRARGWRLPP